MNNLEIKKKLNIILETFIYTLLNHYRVILFACVVMLTFGSISFASDIPPILQKLFDYADNYYNIDNTNNKDVFTDFLKSMLAYIHYNKNTFKTYFEQFSNEEHYNDLNACYLINGRNGIMYLQFCYAPRDSYYSNFYDTYWNGSYYVPLYHYSYEKRLRIYYNPQTGVFDTVDYLSQTGEGIIAGYDWNNYNQWNNCVIIYNDNNYNCSNPNFNGNSSNSNQRINGMADFGFFNLDYSSLNNVEDFINFGNVYIGYNFTQSNMKCYLVDYDNSEILDNDVQLISAGNLYNGRIIYQPILEDLSGLNNNTNYRLVLSSDNSMLKPFYSETFKIKINQQDNVPGGGTIILSGDYSGVGSGDGFTKAINDINNNIGVISNKVDNINNTITDNSKVEEPFNNLLSGDSSEVLNNLGIQQIENPYNDFLLRIFYSIMNTFETSQNVTITLPMRDGLENSYIILNSDDFNHNNVILKVFLSSVIIFFIIYNTYKKFADIISHLSDFDMTRLQVAIDQILYDEVRYF